MKQHLECYRNHLEIFQYYIQLIDKLVPIINLPKILSTVSIQYIPDYHYEMHINHNVQWKYEQTRQLRHLVLWVYFFNCILTGNVEQVALYHHWPVSVTTIIEKS